MSEYTIYHNPACSKSRAALALLQSQGIEPEQQLYLQHAPDEKTILFLAAALGTSLREMMRSTDAAFKNAGLDNPATDDKQLIDALLKNPALLQRPIVVKGNHAVIGRPPENVLALINMPAKSTSQPAQQELKQ